MPVPWEPNQTIYVWVDALLNYRSEEYGLGNDITGTVWPTSLHLMAKDILRLHGIIWPAMLMAADTSCRAGCSSTATSPAAARR